MTDLILVAPVLPASSAARSAAKRPHTIKMGVGATHPRDDGAGIWRALACHG